MLPTDAAVLAEAETKDGDVLSAVTTESGSLWVALDRQTATYPRRLVHLRLMAVAVLPAALTAASAPERQSALVSRP